MSMLLVPALMVVPELVSISAFTATLASWTVIDPLNSPTVPALEFIVAVAVPAVFISVEEVGFLIQDLMFTFPPVVIFVVP